MSEPGADCTRSKRVDSETNYRIEAFLYDEAALLDRRAYDDWFLLIAEEIQYEVHGRVVRDAGADRTYYPIITADYSMLARRAKQISTPKLTHAENPPSLTRRFISNVRSFSLPDGTLMSHCNFLIYRRRLETPDFDLYAGERTDFLIPNGVSFLIAKRQAALDHTSFTGSLSILI